MNMKWLLSWVPFYFLAFLLFPINEAKAASIDIGIFTGGDTGEGLDLDGNFTYAVNAFGPDSGLVRDANFLSEGNSPGVTVSATNSVPSWSNPSYGITTNDDNLEIVMQSIRWSPGPVAIDLDTTQGGSYRLQLLFTESNCCQPRAFGVLAEGILIADQFNPGVVMGGRNGTPTQGTVVTYDFIAGDSQLNIILDGAFSGGTPDNAPLISGFTLEQMFELASISLTEANINFSNSPMADSFGITGGLLLGIGNNGIDPINELVLVNLGTGNITVPSGSFVEISPSQFEFIGIVEGTSIEITIEENGVDDILFDIFVEGVDLSDTPNPMVIGVTIGDDRGLENIRFEGKLKLKIK